VKESRYIEPEYEMLYDWDGLCDELALKYGYRSKILNNEPVPPNNGVNADPKTPDEKSR
jgi:hypothetical protein